MATLVLAFNAGIDRPLPAPVRLADGGAAVTGRDPDGVDPSVHLQSVTRALEGAAFASLEAAAAEAVQRRSLALVLFGDILDPRRASPAQAAALRQLVVSLGAQGCRTICVLSENREASELVRALGSPDHLLVSTPAAPASLTLGDLAVDVAGIGRDGVAVFESTAGAPATRWQIVGESSHAPRSADPRGVGARSMPPLQPRGHDDPPGACGLLRVGTDDPEAADAVRGVPPGWLLPTERIAWRTLVLDAVASATPEEAAAAVASAAEAMSFSTGSLNRTPLTETTILRVRFRCGSVAGRMRLAGIASEVTGRVRSLFCPRAFPYWCEQVEPDPDEPLDSLWRTTQHMRGSSAESRGFATASNGVEMFAAELVSLACGLPRLQGEPADSVGDVRRQTGAVARREAAWLALELLEVA